MNQQLTTADTINDCELIKMRHVTDMQTECWVTHRPICNYMPTGYQLLTDPS